MKIPLDLCNFTYISQCSAPIFPTLPSAVTRSLIPRRPRLVRPCTRRPSGLPSRRARPRSTRPSTTPTTPTSSTTTSSTTSSSTTTASTRPTTATSSTHKLWFMKPFTSQSPYWEVDDIGFWYVGLNSEEKARLEDALGNRHSMTGQQIIDSYLIIEDRRAELD